MSDRYDVPTGSRSEIIAAFEATWASFDSLLEGLTEDEWNMPSLCPEWTTHGIVGHLAAVEHMLTDWMPASAEAPLPFDKVGAVLPELSAMSNAELLDRYRSIIETRRTELAATTDADFALPSMTPVGPQTYGRFMAVRMFDFWVHERDVRVPLDKPGDDGGDHAALALDEVHRSMGYIMGKKVGLTEGQGVTIHLPGAVERDLHTLVDGRAGTVTSLDSPDAVVTLDSGTFMLLACGRIDPAGPIAEGKVTWTGDQELGERVANNLAFTM